MSVPSLRTRIRNEFPVGWWRSARWWFSGLRDIATSCAVAVLTPFFARRVTRILRLRNAPVLLARLTGAVEAWIGAALINLLTLTVMVMLLVTGVEEGSLPIVGGALVMTCWSSTSVVLAAIVLVVLVRSRLRRRDAWRELDFVSENIPRGGRPPETVEEYEALKLRAKQQD